jgi:mono/diheme cytochrome c family protein
VAEQGQALYQAACVACHGETGRGGHGGGPTLVGGNLDNAQIAMVTSVGRNNMPVFREIYTPEQIADIGAYILQRLVPAKP